MWGTNILHIAWSRGQQELIFDMQFGVTHTHTYKHTPVCTYTITPDITLSTHTHTHTHTLSLSALACSEAIREELEDEEAVSRPDELFFFFFCGISLSVSLCRSCVRDSQHRRRAQLTRGGLYSESLSLSPTKPAQPLSSTHNQTLSLSLYLARRRQHSNTLSTALYTPFFLRLSCSVSF